MDCLSETIKTIINICLITQIIIKEGRPELLPTALELMHIETQHLIDEHCIVEEEGERGQID